MTDSDPFQVLKSMALFMQIFNLSNLQDDIPNTQSLSLSLYLFHFQGFEINGSLHANLQPNLHDVPHLPLVRLPSGGHDDDSIKFYHYDKVEHNCDDNLRDFIKHDPSDSKETFQFLVPM